jgi:hypothetical protein
MANWKRVHIYKSGNYFNTKIIAMLKVVIAVLCMTFIQSCGDTSTSASFRNSISLALADTFCTEAYLKLSFADTKTPRTVLITRNERQVFQGEVPTIDTTLADSGLSPNRVTTL